MIEKSSGICEKISIFLIFVSGCDVKLNAYRSAIAAPIYLKQPGSVNCTYDINSDHNASVALSFSKLNISKGSVIVWDGEGKASDPVINYTSKYFGVAFYFRILWKNQCQCQSRTI